MRFRFISDAPLGSRAFSSARTEKRWIMAAAGLAASIGSSIFGGISSAKAAKRQEERLRNQQAVENASLQRQREESYVDTKAGQNMIRQARDIMDRQTKKARGAQAIGGGTDAAVALQKEQGNKVVGNVIADIASRDTARRDRAEEGQRQANRWYMSAQNAIDTAKANNIAQAASAMGNAVGGFMATFDNGGGVKTKSSAGGEGNV